MIFPRDIIKSTKYPVFKLENFLSHSLRHKTQNTIGLIVVLLILTEVAVRMLNYLNLLGGEIREFSVFFVPKITGIALILFSVWVIFFLMEAFFYSKSYKEKDKKTKVKNFSDEVDLLSFEVGKIIYRANRNDEDITKGFFLSLMGRRILLRSGVSIREQEYFFGVRVGTLYGIQIPVDKQEQLFILPDLVELILNKDTELKEFLFKLGVQVGELRGAAEWVCRENENKKIKERWWSRENLSQIPGIGKDWAYGGAYKLKKYGHEIVGTNYGNMSNISLLKRESEFNQLKDALLRASKSNVLLVGSLGVGVMDLVYVLARKVHSKTINPALEGRKVVLLDTNLLISETRNKGDFEHEVMCIFEDAIGAGNIILVIKNLPEFTMSARAIGSNISSILAPYFSSSAIQIIATSDKDAYHHILERNAYIMNEFEKISINETDNESTIAVLEKTAEQFELTEGLFFTYPAILEIANSANQYITEGSMPNKAIDLLINLVSVVHRKQKTVVVKEDVLDLIEDKTSIPVGKIKQKEREQLEQMEDFLHKRVVGQNEAIHAISDAMRRSRAGVRNMSRPISSFLFLGPTGVGKTETVKALAESFFGDENKITRFDMSEYQGMDALIRLIGESRTNSAGALATSLRDRPYGILLLDEFEKTNTDVHNLFLQILDEGFFTDAYAKKINVRNMIIVATSNAGSDIIWDITKKGGDLLASKNEFIDEIVTEGTFKPELLNRFDKIVLFHPLSKEHLRDIAEISLLRFSKRLRIKNNIEFMVNEAVINFVARQGYKRSFGARPMRRFIQENIEQNIAENIINGQIQKGQHIGFDSEGNIKL